MAHAIALESRKVAEDLYHLIQLLDPATWRSDLELAARDRLRAIHKRVERLQARWSDTPEGLSDEERLRQSLAQVAGVVGEFSPRQHDWRDLFKKLQPAYEAVAARVRAEMAVELPTLRPTNYKRSLLHVSMGLTALTFLQLTPMGLVQAIITGMAVLVVAAETSRRFSPAVNKALMALFAPVAHPHEHYRVNSASWYTMALVILAWTAPLSACSVAVIVLALADPAAALVGRRFGRIKIRAGRTLEGSMTFAVVGFASAWAVLAAFHPELTGAEILLAAALAGILGALGEAWSGVWLDDNFSVPLSAAAGVALGLLLI